MQRILILSVIIFATNVCVSQVADSFSDGDFTGNPAWAGTSADFIINGAQQLQLNNSIAATSYLTTSFAQDLSLVNTEWQVYVKEGFAPSGSNLARFYLVSDQADLTQPLNGYYIQLGEAGTADTPELFKQTGTTRTSVCRAATAGSIVASVPLRLKITRSATGMWELFADYTGGTTFSSEASAADATHTTAFFSGVECVYTITNSTKIYFDDISIVSTAIPDVVAPSLVSILVKDNTSLELFFSEALDAASACNVSNYLVDQNVGIAVTAVLQATAKTVTLTFSNSFKNGYQHILSVTGVKDVAGNQMVAVDKDFLFFQGIPAVYKSVIFTEIFPDPSPLVGLPDAEFVEVLNRTGDPFDLGGWKLSDGNSVATLPTAIILPGDYAIVTSSSNATKFSPNLRLISVPNFPTLNNEGDALTLKDPTDLLIDSVNYSLDWYRNTDKEEGGWSLELIDPENICGEADNWVAAEDVSGGTPGKSNSVKVNKPDLTGPKLRAVVPVTPNQLVLSFDEKLEKSLSPATFTLSPPTTVTQAVFRDLALREIVLYLEHDLAVRQLYNLRIDNLRDCTGNVIQESFSALSFALPEPADSLDVVINEVLFNPRPGGVDFVEISNTTPKYINLKNWKVSNFEDEVPTNPVTIIESDFLLAPGALLALTPDGVALKSQYPTADENNFLESNLPGLSDDEGSLAIINEAGDVIDAFLYSHQYHSQLVQDEEGVSLERISASQPTSNPANWKSATSISGFATPGAINSNSRPDTPITAGSVEIDPEVFSPGSGYNDFAKINFSFEQSSCVANVKVYDQQGHLVKTIANNATLGFEGSFRWDGDRDDGNKARMGYYVVWFEVVDLTGSTQTFRKRVVVAARD